MGIPTGGSGKEEQGGENHLIHSETINSEKRRYFLDLRENARGRFLRITQTFTPTGPRFSIALPAQGIVELRDALVKLLDEFAEGYLDGAPLSDVQIRDSDQLYQAMWFRTACRGVAGDSQHAR